MNDFSDYFDKTYVINLKSRPDRLQDFLIRLANANMTGVSVFNAIDGRICKPPAWWSVSEGAWGCLMSHLRLAQDALQMGLKNYLVLEDDVIFCEDFYSKLETFMDSMEQYRDDWDMIYLGGQHYNNTVPFRVNKHVVKGVNINRTHAMAVNAKFMVKFCQHLIHAPDYIEKALSPRKYYMHIDHQLGELHPFINVFAPTKFICGQAAGTSDIGQHTKTENWWN